MTPEPAAENAHASQPTPHIDWVRFDAAGWQVQEESPNRKVWITETGDAVILTFEHGEPDLESTALDINEVRAHCRQLAAQFNQGMVEAERASVAGVPVNRCIVKRPQEPLGMSYLGFFILPFADCSWMVNVACHEQGATGLRESVIVAEKFHAGEVRRDPAEQTMIGWCRDPYDPAIVPPFGYNLSESRAYDSRFPSHPLSRVRAILNRIENTLVIDDPGRRLKPFVQPRQRVAASREMEAAESTSGRKAGVIGVGVLAMALLSGGLKGFKEFQRGAPEGERNRQRAAAEERANKQLVEQHMAALHEQTAAVDQIEQLQVEFGLTDEQMSEILKQVWEDANPDANLRPWQIRIGDMQATDWWKLRNWDVDAVKAAIEQNR
jgi:hypothetical protein